MPLIFPHLINLLSNTFEIGRLDVKFTTNNLIHPMFVSICNMFQNWTRGHVGVGMEGITSGWPGEMGFCAGVFRHCRFTAVGISSLLAG